MNKLEELKIAYVAAAAFAAVARDAYVKELEKQND